MKIVRTSESWNYEGVYGAPYVKEIASGDDLNDLFLEMENKAREYAKSSDRFSRVDFEKVNEKCYSLYYYNAISKEYYTLLD